jgi:hypothetical protein
MCILLDLFLSWTINHYNLHKHVYNGFVYNEMRWAVWGLPQAGILVNKRLWQKLALFGYFECDNTPGLWYHESHPVSFTLVVNNFGVKSIGKDHAMHLIESIKKTYTLTKDWTRNLYCGISLEWDYINRTVDISMPNYIKKKLQEYNHVLPKRPHYCPYLPKPQKVGSEAQAPLPPNDLPHIDAKGIKAHPTNCGKHFLLCQSRQHDRPHVTFFNQS